jgi:hypothetical protein
MRIRKWKFFGNFIVFLGGLFLTMISTAGMLTAETGISEIYIMGVAHGQLTLMDIDLNVPIGWVVLFVILGVLFLLAGISGMISCHAATQPHES